MQTLILWRLLFQLQDKEEKIDLLFLVLQIYHFQCSDMRRMNFLKIVEKQKFDLKI